MSARFSLREVVDWCGGTLRRGDPDRVCDGVSIDSRRVPPTCLFVAIRGERHDAHDFVDAAAAAGAALLVESGRAYPGDSATVEVEDTTRALGALGAGVRRRFTGPLIGITGSNGKTSTKELASAALGTAHPHLKTEGNLNNQFGVPLTLLRLEPRHEVAVVEMGTNHPGEIAHLCELASPTIGVLTNVGTAHAEFLGGRDGVAREKGALFEALPTSGVAVVNADDPFVREQARRSAARCLLFGRGADADVCAEDVVSLGLEGFRFTLRTPSGRASTRIPNIGDVHIHNALAAAAAALAAGASVEEIAAGLSHTPVVGGRLEALTLPGGVTVLNDAYNANPQSMRAALETLRRLAEGRRAIAVLGDMGELGPGATEFHSEVGHAAAEIGVDVVIAVGQHGTTLRDAASKGGLAENACHHAEDASEAGPLLRELVREGDWVLLKGSRAMAMERVLEALERD